MIETLKLFRFGNNRKVQARWVAVGFCIIVALIALNTLGIQPSVATSSFIGAATSLVVNWVVSTIEEGKPRNTPKPLLDAAHEDLETVGYYDQVITVSIKEDKQRGDVVELFMESLLVPINGKSLVKHQKVTAAAGLLQLDDKYYYKVGDKIIPPQGEEWIERPTRDCLSIHYRIDAGANFPIKDRHSWSSPVLDYRDCSEPARSIRSRSALRVLLGIRFL